MNRSTFRTCQLAFVAGTVLFSSFLAPAGAIERSLLGIHIYSNVKTVLHRFGNPTYVLNAGQSYNTTTSSVTYSGAPQMPGQGAGSDQIGNALPPLQPLGGPVSAYGAPQLPEDYNTATADTAPVNGEVTLVYEKGNGNTYEFVLSTSGSVVQITALGYSDPIAKTIKGIRFGSTYTQLLNHYGYPESQNESDGGVRVVDYAKRAHVAFELLNNQVVGIVVAAVD
jgi:hypothetical protein